jgi:hypothetical protein
MKLTLAALGLGLVITGAAMAQTAEVRLVNQCVRDSASYPVSEQVKTMYCTCMVTRMPDGETRSVTQFERANPAIRDDCARRAGWN